MERRIAGKTGRVHQLGKDGSGNFSMSKKISTIVFLHDQPDLVLLVTSCSYETAMAAQLLSFI
jgi:hypothetical protein